MVSLLLAHSAALGLVRVAFETCANALLIQRFGASALAWAMIGSALINPLLSYGYTRLGQRNTWTRVFTLSLSFLVLLTLLVRLSLGLEQNWPVWFLVISFHCVYLLTGLEFWGLCSQLLDLRQAKRLLGLIGSGELAAQIALGLAIPWLLLKMQTADLLWISLLGLLLCLGLLKALTGQSLSAGSETEAEEASGAAVSQGNHYLKLLWAATAGATLCYCFVFQIFFDLAGQLWTEERQLASFLGLYQAGVGGLALLLAGLGSRMILERAGLSLSLLLLPVGTLLLALLLIGGSLASFPLMGLFALALLLKAQDDVFSETLYRPAFQTLRQPLSSEQRQLALTVGEGWVEPLLGGASGLLLLALTQWLKWGVIWQAGALLAFALFWALACASLARRYRELLLQSLSRRVLQPAKLGPPTSRRHQGALDGPMSSPSVQALSSALDDPDPGVTLYGLKLLEELAPNLWLNWIKRNLGHPSPQIRRYTVEQVQQHRLESCLPAVAQRLETESDPGVRGSLVQCLAGLGGSDYFEATAGYLDDPELNLRLGALIGFLQSGEIEGVVLAGSQLTRWLDSPLAEERLLAAKVLLAVGNPGLHRPVLRLLRDPDLSVRALAIQAAARLGPGPHWALILESLALAEIRGQAVAALIAGGRPILGELDSYFRKPGQSAKMRRRLVRVVARIKHPVSGRWLLEQLQDGDAGVRAQILLALCQGAYQSQMNLKSPIEQQLRVELDLTRTHLDIWQDLQGQDAAELSRSLSDTLHNDRQRVLLCLSLLLDANALQKVRDCFDPQLHSQQSAQASLPAGLEVLEASLPRHLRAEVMALFDPEPRPPLMTLTQRAEQLAAHPSDWLRACAERLLKPTSEWEPAMLSTLERVLVLKRLSLFAETPDEVLAEAAQALEEVDLAAGQTLFEVGDLGNRLYIIVFGQVKVHVQDKVLNQLGPGQVFGELSVLDAEPRTASVTTLEDSRFLQLSQAALYELMSDHAEVMRGIVRFLTSHLRVRFQEQSTAPL